MDLISHPPFWLLRSLITRCAEVCPDWFDPDTSSHYRLIILSCPNPWLCKLPPLSLWAAASSLAFFFDTPHSWTFSHLLLMDSLLPPLMVFHQSSFWWQHSIWQLPHLPSSLPAFLLLSLSSLFWFIPAQCTNYEYPLMLQSHVPSVKAFRLVASTLMAPTLRKTPTSVLHVRVS